MKLPDELLDELALVYARAAVDAFIAGEQSRLKTKSARTALANETVQAQELSTWASLPDPSRN
jgi:hypothetical protein